MQATVAACPKDNRKPVLEITTSVGVWKKVAKNLASDVTVIQQILMRKNWNKTRRWAAQHGRAL